MAKAADVGGTLADFSHWPTTPMAGKVPSTMKRSPIILILVALIVSACSGAGSDPSTTTAAIVSATPTDTATARPSALASPTSTAPPTATLLPTLPPTPTLTVPDDLQTCLVTDDPPGQFGCLITTFAGGGEPRIGDGGPATEAEFAYPSHVYADEEGRVYVADSLHGRIRVFRPGGVIQPFAGAGSTYGAAVDGIPATEALLWIPAGMEIGPDGLFYFVEYKHHMVRRIEADGTLSTIVGGGLQPNMGGSLGDGGPATRASLMNPGDIEFDAQGNLYVSDSSNNRVRRVDTQGFITSVLGKGGPYTKGILDPSDPYTVLNPEALAVDSEGQLYVGHTGAIRILDLRSGEARTLEGVSGVSSIVISEQDEIYVTLPGRNQVARLHAGRREPLEIIAGTGQAGFSGDGGDARDAMLDFPHDLALGADGELFIADSNNNRVRMIDRAGVIRTVAGGPSSLTAPIPVPAGGTVFNTSNGLVFDRVGNLIVTDYDLNTIRRIDREGYATVVAGRGGSSSAGGDGGHPTDAYITSPRAPVFDFQGNLLFIDESNGTNVVRRIYPGVDGLIDGSPDEFISTVVGIPGEFERTGSTRVDNVPAAEAIINHPRGMDLDSDGNLYIADWLDHRVLKVTPGEDGVITGEQDEIVSAFAGTGEPRVSGNGGPASEASVSLPWWIAVDSNDDIFVYEQDPEQPVIRRIDGESGIIEVVVNHHMIDLHRPTTFTFDHHDNLYVAESTRIFRVDPDTGRTVHIAGDGTGGWSPWPGGFAGDGGDARSAKAQFVQFLAVDGEGNLYFDDGNRRIRKVTFVALSDGSAPHPVPTWTPIASEAISSPPETPPPILSSSATASQRSGSDGTELSVQFTGRLGPNQHGEIEYEFSISRAAINAYHPDDWGLESNCEITGMGAHAHDTFTVGLPSDLPSQTCTLSLELPTGQRAATTFEHEQ